MYSLNNLLSYSVTKAKHFVIYTVLVSGIALSYPSFAALDLNGIASNSEYGNEQFLAALYLEELSSDSNQILLGDQRKRMEIKVITDRLLARKFKNQWIEGVAINAGNIDLKKHAQNLADFSNMLNVKLIKNDTLTIERTFRRGVEVAINGVALGAIEDPSFFDLLLRSWIGPVPLSSEFKTGLLKAGSIDPLLLARFEEIRTTPARVASLTDGLKLAIAEQGSTTRVSRDEALVNEPAPLNDPTPTISSLTTSPEEVATSSEAIKSKDAASSGPLVAVRSASQPSSTRATTASSEPLPTVASGQIMNQESVFDDEADDFSYTAADLLSRQLYLSKLTKWTSSHIKYPNSALRRGEEGTVRVSVIINRAGEVIVSELIQESEVNALNKEASKAIHRSSPYPAVPDVIEGETFEFTLPVVFRLR